MRKLNFQEVMLVSKMLREMNVKEYIENLTKHIDKIFKSKNTKQEDMQKEIAIDVITWIVQNLEKAENTVYELLASYKSTSVKDIKVTDMDEIIECIKEIFTSGLPKIISNMVDLGEVKKKLSKDK